MERRGRMRSVETGADAARVPPHDLDAEKAVIGALLVSETAVAAVAEQLTPEEFYSERHRAIYGAMMRLYARGDRIDQITLTNELSSVNEFDQVGGRAYIFNLVESVPTASNAARYAEIVRGKALLRSVIDVGSRITEDAFREPEDVSEALDSAEQLIYGVSNRTLRQHLAPVSELAPGALEMIQRLYEQEGEVTGVETGFEDLDRLTTGFHKSDLVILAARPAMGKTAMALNAIWHASSDKKMPVAIFSLEMSKEQLVQRLISQTTRIPAQALRSGNVKAEDWPKLLRGVAQVSEAPIWIDDTAGVTLMEMRAKVRRLASQLNAQGQAPLSLVVVDYLQLMIGQGSRNDNRQQEIAEISRGLKVLARDLDVPVLAIAQLSRAVESRHDKRPMLSDLRDCLPGTALITDADTGERLPIKRIVDKGLRPNVWAVDDDLRLVKRGIVDAWAVGRKNMVEVELRSGLVLRCSEGHRLLGEDGWTRADDLAPGQRVGLPRRQAEPSGALEEDPRKWLLCGWLLGDGYLNGSASLTTATAAEARFAAWLGRAVFGIRPVVKPERASPAARKVIFTTGSMTGAGKNPMTRWLRRIEAWGHTGRRKHAPEAIWTRSDASVEAFLRGLFHADGSLTRSGGAPNVRLATISERLARDVQLLLLRLGIRASVHEHSTAASGYRPSAGTSWTVYVGGLDNVRIFARRIGFLGSKHSPLARCLKKERRGFAGSLDRVPALANSRVREIKAERDLSWTEVGWREQGKLMSRERARELGAHLDDPVLERFGNSDVLWEEVRTVRTVGREQAYDITVEDVHNFAVDGFITHNSGAIEQDADMVMFLYRDEYYNPDSDDKGIAEVIVGKHRNGPTGKVQLAWLEQYTKFASLARRG
jgi:replicative DNA helicase